MKIFISEIDRQNSRSVALKNIARFFGIENWEFKTNEELNKDIVTSDIPNALTIRQLLQNYFRAYDEWFKFYQNKKAIEQQQEEEYILNAEEQLELQVLIENRERTLGELQSEFDRLQLQKINQDQLGTDINGMLN